MSDYIEHYGMPRRSGRYPWGSGKDPYQSARNFKGYVDKLTESGVPEKKIAEGMGMSINQLRARYSNAQAEKKKGDITATVRLKGKGYSNRAIADRLGISEATVRNYLNPATKQRASVLNTTKDSLKEAVDRERYIDIGLGSESFLGVSRTRLKNAVTLLEDEGYTVHKVYQSQLGMSGGEKTAVWVLAPPGVTYKEVVQNKDKIRTIASYSTNGEEILGLPKPPVNISSDRIKIQYNEEGGILKDGVIELRRGVADISLGESKYAQVRIAVDGTHYLKGMAMYADDLPDGVDIRFNTNKHVGTPKEEVFKKQKDDPQNPFGSSIKAQRTYVDKDGVEKQSALNIVREEGEWEKWSKKLSSQVLSKQDPSLAEKQLKIVYDAKKAEFDEIKSLTNPEVQRKLMDSFSSDCDSSAVHLKAAALPRQSSYVILPITDLSEREVYAPRYRDGEDVVLIRYPHAGQFEIPQLKVNNKHRHSKEILGEVKDAIGINPKVAEQLSGADFDGDTVLVIPNPGGMIKASSPLKQLEGFDPKELYKLPADAPKMSSKTKQTEMGKVSNLITDMTIKGATQDEIARAVRHSMVVIDAEKHHLDYKQSERDNGIGELKKKYQGASNAGASTLISKASSEVRIPKQKPGQLVTDPKTGKTKMMYIDPQTGKKLYRDANETYTQYKKRPDGTYENLGTRVRTEKAKRMSLVDDAFELSSGSRIEEVYATHANKLKALANEARRTLLLIKSTPYSPSARKVYRREYEELSSALKMAQKNKPLERQAQLLAEAKVNMKKQANPDMDSDELKKLTNQELVKARVRTGADKTRIDITPRQWEAIQAGAISSNMLTQILTITDLDKVKEYATPRQTRGLSAAQISRARTMQAAGATQAEIADSLGVSTSTIVRELS